MAKNKNKNKGKYNRTHSHGQQNNATPDNDQPGLGPNPNRGHGPAGAMGVEGIDNIIARAIRGGAKVAYGDQLRENREQFQQLRGQGREIDRAYDAYANSIGGMQEAQAQRTADLVGQTTDAGVALGNAAGAITAGGAAQADQRAATLGFGDSESSAYTALGSDAGLSRADVARSMVNQQANVGLANQTSLTARAAIGKRDKVRSREDLQQLKRGNREERQQILREKGGWMADRLYEYLQQQEENDIAREGLQLQRREARTDRRDTRHDNRLADTQEQHDYEDQQHDNELADQEAADNGGGAGGSGGQGLSPTDQDDYRQTTKLVQGFYNEYKRLIDKGLSPSSARKKAARAAGVGSQTWVIRVGTALYNGDGSLGQGATTILRSHLPDGSQIPDKWR